ncbi:hypothetical protein NOV72_06228 [Caballeronia novacaledonica]|uniref:Uncharacterized protein n=1 Tax=Caballeronia novacaledonica TaxID=1544861 RepID=A0A2U3IFL2_9BURK|nr:hypothetical protein NOV72_06228 [Caballeronia novacaledonica]
MHAVLRVDLQTLVAVVGLHELVHGGRAVAAFRTGIGSQIHVDRHARILQRQMRGLVLFVIRVRDEHRREPVERELAIGLRIDDRLALRRRLQHLVIPMLMMQRPRHVAAHHLLLQADHEGAEVQALAHPLLEVARAMQFGLEPRGVEGFGVRRELVILAACLHGFEGGFGGHLARLDRRVTALDARCVQETRVVARERAAGERELRQRHQTARGDRPRAVGNALAAFEERANRRMRLVALEFLERRQVRIRISQPDDESHHHLIVVHVVEERSAVGVGFERPARGVDDESRLVLDRIDFPQLLDADAVHLRIGILVELEFIDQLTAEMSARTFAKERVFRVQFHAELEVLGRLAIFADAHIARDDAAHRAVVGIEDFGGGKARENLDAQRFRLLPEPARDVGK